MVTRTVTKNEDISSFINDRFIFCKELGKGFVKRDLDTSLLPSNFTFEDAITTIGALTASQLITMKTDMVLFEEGLESVSTKHNKIISKEIADFAKDASKTMDIINTKLGELKTRWQYNRFDFVPSDDGKFHLVLPNGSELRFEIGKGLEPENPNEDTDGLKVVDGYVTYGTGEIDYILIDTVDGKLYRLLSTDAIMSLEEVQSAPVGLTAQAKIELTDTENSDTFEIQVSNGMIELIKL